MSENSQGNAGLAIDPEQLAALYAACATAAEPDVNSSSDSADSGSSEISAPTAAAMAMAREESGELGGNAPDAVSAALLRLLAHTAQARSAVYLGEAPGVVALSLLNGMRKGGTVTAITSDPHHAQAGKKALAAARFPSNACRFISTRPVEVLGKLATGSYDLVVAQAGIVSAEVLATRGLELAGDGSVVVLGSITEFDELAATGSLPAGARLQRFPLGDGIVTLYQAD